jgi:exonuclease SbcC
MIPIRLQIRNFMCYTDVHAPLLFDGFQLACLSGQNGHGKSALLDAMTWALWGKSRARTADELIHAARSAIEMEVEFEFLLGSDCYRVIRKRSRRGRGQTVLELAARQSAGGAFRAMTGNNVGETERQIEQLLRMSYETFTNSSFILQGRADSFTTRTPGERKQVLAEILELAYYDRLEERARERTRQREEQRRALQQQIADDDAELQQEPALRERLGQLEAGLAGLDERLKLTEAQGEALRERVGRLQAGARELHDQERRLAEARERADRQRKLIAAAVAELARAEQIVAREPEIEQRHAELQTRRAELERLTLTQAEYNRLSQEVARLERSVVQARGQLEGRREQLRGQLAALDLAPERAAQQEREVAAARVELHTLETQEAKRAKLDLRLTEARETYAALKSSQTAQAERLKELRERKEMLGSSGTCPVCRTALGSEQHRRVVDQYAREEQATVAQEREAGRQRQEVERLGKALRAEIEQLGSLPDRRKQLQERLSRAEQGLARSAELQRQAGEVRSSLATVETALAESRFAEVDQRNLALLREQLAGLGYDPAVHQTTSAAVTALTSYDALRQSLVEAKRSLAREQATRDEAERALVEWETAARHAEERRAELLVETNGLAAAQQELAAAETALRELRLTQGRLNQDLGAVRQHLATMAFTAQRRDERRAEFQRIVIERQIYQDLSLAFGKKGLQAMLIEAAIPELEDEANALLGLMSDGRMRVTFETQRAARSGDTVETLDINISDELGTRAYEMYSGGEAFRVNFAIRIALSKLLARRAGAKLQLLVIDEGFGSQDEQGRERLVEAIKAIQHQFEKILVITHLDDLKDLFPVRIEVVKTAAGSVIEVH